MLRAFASFVCTFGRPARAGIVAAGFVAAALLSGCAQVADDGTPKDRKLSDSDKLALELEQNIGFVDDPELVSYVETVGGRIAVQTKRKDIDFRFKILDMPAPNALALPDGQVFVSRGVLVLVNSEDELASILAHEIAHVEERHASERENLALVTSPIRLGAGIAGWATGLVIPDLGDAIVELGESTTGLLIAPYSREQEREADRVGQTLAAASGYDPQGLAELLDTMVTAEALDPEFRVEQSWFDTHPATSERVEATRDYGASLTPEPRPQSALDRAGVLDTLDGLIIGGNPANGFFDENWFVHPDLAFVIGFPLGWEGINTGGFVGAKKDGEEIFVMLALVARGSDPMLGAKEASRRLQTDLVTNAITGHVNGLAAAKNRVQVDDERAGVQLVELTWIAHGGRIFQVMAVAPVERFEAEEEVMTKSAHSFRPLADEERANIAVLKLRVVEARGGESIAELSERVQTPLTPQTVAVMNRKSIDARLEQGEPLKVGIRERYSTEPEVPFARPAER